MRPCARSMTQPVDRWFAAAAKAAAAKAAAATAAAAAAAAAGRLFQPLLMFIIFSSPGSTMSPSFPGMSASAYGAAVGVRHAGEMAVGANGLVKRAPATSQGSRKTARVRGSARPAGCKLVAEAAVGCDWGCGAQAADDSEGSAGYASHLRASQRRSPPQRPCLLPRLRKALHRLR